ncbi:MAG: DUF805 domain-containing protein [Acidimicrobiales bacterium]
MGFFDGSDRIGRLTYLAISIAIGVVSVVAVFALVQVDEVTQEASVNPLVVPVLLGTTWLSITTTIRRLHDTGRSGWTALLLMVPIIGPVLSLYLLFAPGDPVLNLYGRPPGAREVSVAEQRQRNDLLATVAGEAYRARAASSFLNADGTYDMDGLENEGRPTA